jgi:ornithine carbamoyltransferase
VRLEIQTQQTFSHTAEVAKHNVHQILVREFLKVKIWDDVHHTKVPNGVLANNLTNFV